MNINRKKVYYEAEVTNRKGDETSYGIYTKNRLVALLQAFAFAGLYGFWGVEIEINSRTAESICKTSLLTRKAFG